MFAGQRIAFVASNNMPVANTTSLTTIGKPVRRIDHTVHERQGPSCKPEGPTCRESARATRKLDDYFAYAQELFVQLGKHFKELDTFFSVKNTEPVVKKHRGNHGGNALFRPIGLEIFTRVIARLTVDMSLAQAVTTAARLPRSLDEEPF